MVLILAIKEQFPNRLELIDLLLDLFLQESSGSHAQFLGMLGAEVLDQLSRLITMVDINDVLNALGQPDVDLEYRHAKPLFSILIRLVLSCFLIL